MKNFVDPFLFWKKEKLVVAGLKSPYFEIVGKMMNNIMTVLYFNEYKYAEI